MTGTLKDYKIEKDVKLFQETQPKKKSGRKPTNRKRHQIVVYLYDDEYERFKEVVDGENASGLIRRLLKNKYDI